jgi:Ca2+-binding RTX toxin-like protein
MIRQRAWVGRRLAMLVAAAALVALALPSAASAAATCSYDSAQKRLLITYTDGISTITVRLNESDPNNVKISVLENGVALTAGNCQDVLRSQTDTVAFDSSGGIPALVIEEPDNFTPAFSAETPPAQSEVNFAVSGGLMINVVITDTDDDADNMQLGTNGINYNIGEGDSDVDITFSNSLPPDLVLNGSDGGDIFDATGGAPPPTGTGDPLAVRVAANAGGGPDTVLGGADNDTIQGGPGDDFLRGGGGLSGDEYNFSSSPTAVRADLAVVGSQETGSQGVDDIAGFENVEGTGQADVLFGDGGPNILDGNGGNDILAGRGGADDLAGDAGNDTASYAGAPSAVTANLALSTAQNTGGGGTDTYSSAQMENLEGSAFADDLQGSGGPNTITGGAGTDKIQTLGGVDRVEARDGEADAVDCGLDADTGIFDLVGVDTVSGCESSLFLTRPSPAKPAPTTGPAKPAGQLLVDRSVELIISAADTQRIGAKGVAVTLECPRENCSVKASASLKEPKAKKKRKRARGAKTLRLKGASLRLEAGKERTVRLKLSGKNLRRTVRALRKRGKRRVSILATATDAAGNKDTADDQVKLKAPPKPKKKKAKRSRG